MPRNNRLMGGAKQAMALLLVLLFFSAICLPKPAKATEAEAKPAVENNAEADKPKAESETKPAESVTTEKPSAPVENPTVQPENPAIPQIPAVLVISTNYNVPEYKAGQKNVQLELPLLNWGNVTASHVTVEPEISNESDKFLFPFVMKKGNYALGYPDIKSVMPGTQSGGQSKKFGPFEVRSDIATGYYRIQYNISWYDSVQGWQQVKRFAYVKVNNPKMPSSPNGTSNDGGTETPNLEEGYSDISSDGGGFVGGDDGKRSMPRLIVSGFETEPKEVKGGDKFTLKLKLRNTSKDGAVSNIRMVLAGSPEGENQVVTFLPVTGASTVFVDKVNTDSEKEIKIELQSNASLPQKAYPLNIKMQYEDSQLNAVEGDETISIYVHQEAKIDFGKVDLSSDTVGIGEEVNISFPLINKGKSTLYNMSILVPEDGILQKAENYVGNVNSGEQKDVDLSTIALQESNGEHPKIQIKYEDEMGKVYTIDKEIELNVDPEMMTDPSGLETGMENFATSGEGDGRGFSWLWLLPLLLLAGAVIVYFFIKKHKRQKSELAELDDDEMV